MYLFVAYFRADGGVSRNDFVMQLLSTLTGQSIERPVQVEMSCLGAAFLAGLAVGGYFVVDVSSCLLTCRVQIIHISSSNQEQ
jgi:glycerol kinase